MIHILSPIQTRISYSIFFCLRIEIRIRNQTADAIATKRCPFLIQLHLFICKKLLDKHTQTISTNLVVQPSSASEISLRQKFRLETRNEQTEVLNEIKNLAFLYINQIYFLSNRLTKTVKEKQLNYERLTVFCLNSCGENWK